EEPRVLDRGDQLLRDAGRGGEVGAREPLLAALLGDRALERGRAALALAALEHALDDRERQALALQLADAPQQLEVRVGVEGAASGALRRRQQTLRLVVAHGVDPDARGLGELLDRVVHVSEYSVSEYSHR